MQIPLNSIVPKSIMLLLIYFYFERRNIFVAKRVPKCILHYKAMLISEVCTCSTSISTLSRQQVLSNSTSVTGHHKYLITCISNFLRKQQFGKSLLYADDILGKARQ